jgi:hypothetical protein
MSEKSKEKGPQKLAKSRRDCLAQAKMLTVDERTHEAAEINKALGIKAPKATDAGARRIQQARAGFSRRAPGGRSSELFKNGEVMAWRYSPRNHPQKLQFASVPRVFAELPARRCARRAPTASAIQCNRVDAGRTPNALRHHGTYEEAGG